MFGCPDVEKVKRKPLIEDKNASNKVPKDFGESLESGVRARAQHVKKMLDKLPKEEHSLLKVESIIKALGRPHAME